MSRIGLALMSLMLITSLLMYVPATWAQEQKPATVPALEAPLEPTVIQFPEIIDKAVKVRSYTEVGLTPEFVVRGDVVFNAPILTAEVLRFEPGSRLRFSREARKAGDLYVVAKKIFVSAKNSSIGWFPPEQPVGGPPSRGKAIPGAPGNFFGASGAPGSAGAFGNPGYGGDMAPTLYLFVGEIHGAALSIDLSGQDGATGGEGEGGGDGGAGAPGTPAVSARIALLGVTDSAGCKAPGGRGGTGGPGGKGGKGGVGGSGGDGGALVVLSPADSTLEVREQLVVVLNGGSGGSGGVGGIGGEGGPPGPGGIEESGCAPGQPGDPGLPGASGEPGDVGLSGHPGDYIGSELTKDQFRRILGIYYEED
jgi:hypothetical protein